MKALGLFTALSLAVCIIASGVVSNGGSSYAATSSLDWKQITIPSTDEKQLDRYTDIGPMAVSPDGETVFAAVLNEPTNPIPNVWNLYKSIDGAFSWQNTDLSTTMAAIGDTGDIVAVELSPNWNTDGLIFVATENRLYYSDDRGRTFDNIVPVPGTIYAAGTDVITSLAIQVDETFSGGLVIAVGTKDPTAAVGGDVYILDLGAWTAQGVGTYDVLAVGLSPNYATDEAVIAVVTDTTLTMLRAKLGVGAWGAAVGNAIFKDQGGNDFVSGRASLGIPVNYLAASGSTSMLVFVGLSAAGPLGDVFSIQWTGWPATSTVDDLDVRGDVGAGNPSETNVWSIAISGTGTAVTIIAGTEEVNAALPPTSPVPGQLLVYTSLDSGISWQPDSQDGSYLLSYKQPTGGSKATVVMASSVAYLGCFGDQSAVSAALSTGGFSSWDQRGLIDTTIGEITDMSPSEGYFGDGTIYITTKPGPGGDASLWRTQTEGGTWARVYCSTLTTPGTCVFDMLRLTGDAVIVAQRGGTTIVPSTDDGAFFQATRTTASLMPITTLAVVDENTFYVGHANGIVWRSTDAGVTWPAGGQSTGDIPSTDTVVDLVVADEVVYAGTNNGGLYSASTSDLDFSRVGPSKPGGPGDMVYVAPNPCDENLVYVGLGGGVPEVWRFDLASDNAEWEQFEIPGSPVGDLSSIVCSDCIGGDSILYAISTEGKGWRWVNPTETDKTQVGEDIVGSYPIRRGLKLVYGTNNILFAIGGASYTQLWTASDEINTVKLLAPEDGEIAGYILEDEAFLGRAVVTLEWKEVKGAESYEVQIAYDEAMDSPVDMSYYADGNPYSAGMVKVAYPWLGTRYYWRVRVGKAGLGGTEGAPLLSKWSDVWSFVTPLGPAPSIPVLVSPQAGERNVILRPALQWNSSVNATAYELILAVNGDWANPVLNLSGEDAIPATATAYQLTFSLVKNTDYCWKVRGVNAITHSPWSDSLSFTTGVTEEVVNEGIPVWVWVIIAMATVFILSVLVLIIQSRRY